MLKRKLNIFFSIFRDTPKKRRTEKKNYIQRLPREVIDLIHDHVVTQTKRKLLIAMNLRPWPSTRVVEASMKSQSPWVAIFQSFKWLDRMIEEYNVTPLLIGNTLDPERLKNPLAWGRCPYLVLYIGAKRPISEDLWQLFMDCLRDQKFRTIRNQCIRLWSGTILNLGDLFNSKE